MPSIEFLDLLVAQQQKVGAMGYRKLLEHSLVLYELFPLFIQCQFNVTMHDSVQVDNSV